MFDVSRTTEKILSKTRFDKRMFHMKDRALMSFFSDIAPYLNEKHDYRHVDFPYKKDVEIQGMKLAMVLNYDVLYKNGIYDVKVIKLSMSACLDEGEYDEYITKKWQDFYTKWLELHEQEKNKIRMTEQANDSESVADIS